MEAQSGNVTLAIVDGSGATLVDETYLAGKTLTKQLEDAGGNWTIRLDYAAFIGNVSVSVQEASKGETVTTSQTKSSTQASATEGSADRTGSFPLVREKDTPMPGAVPLALALLAMAFLVVRRRLA